MSHPLQSFRTFLQGRKESDPAGGPSGPTRGLMTLCVDGLVYLFVRLAIAIIGVFSIEACHEMAIFLAVLFTDVFPVRKRVLEENLTIAFPDASPKERRRLTRKMWEHLFLMGGEFVLARRVLHQNNWVRFIETKDAQTMVRLFFQKRPLIMVTGHLGNFEMGGYSLGLLGYPTFSVARSLDNPFLNRYIANLRESTGQFLIEKNGGYEDILTIMENRGLVAFLADQSAGPKGCWVDFFGHPASAYKAMALLSLQYNAPILVCSATRQGGPMRFRIEPLGLFDPENPPEGVATPFEITQWFTTLLEEGIRRDPGEYWWLHRRWKDYGRQISIDTIRRKIRFRPQLPR